MKGNLISLTSVIKKMKMQIFTEESVIFKGAIYSKTCVKRPLSKIQ